MTSKSTNSGSKEPTTMEELLALQQDNKPLVTLKRRQVVEAVIAKISPKEIIVELGGKAEGIIAGKDLDPDAAAKLKIGDKVPVTIMQTDSDNDYIVCSMQVFTDTRKLSSVTEAMETEEPIEVKIVEERKGGFLVNYNGVRGFLPASQVSLDYVGKPKDMVGKNFPVKVIEFDADTPRLIVSQKAVVSDNEKQARSTFFATATIGDEVQGTVAAILPFGIVVNVNGVEGFVHISEIAWERVENINQYFKVSEGIKGSITGINEDEGKITISVKQLSDSPWSALAEKFAAKEQVNGLITKPTTQGFLVRIESGIIGLIHRSQLADGEELADGQAVTCMIDAIDLEKKRVNLTLVR